jgi:23S rRNA (adenosine1067-2'-O)-methyltransferase
MIFAPSPVDSLLHPKALELRALLDGEDKTRILVDDEENIDQALRAGVTLETVFYAGTEALSDAFRKRLPHNVTVHEIAKRTAKKLFETDRHSRLFAVARRPSPNSFDALARRGRDFVVLEGLAIVGNIGAIVRTATAFGMGGVVLLDSDVDLYDRRLIRASRGYVFSLPVMTATAEELLRFCDKHDWQLALTSPRASQDVQELAEVNARLAMVFGSEKFGCSATLQRAVSLRVAIATSASVESLNVSTAVGIVLYQRHRANGVLSGLRPDTAVSVP